MLVIESGNIKKFYGDRLVLDIDKLNIYSEDRIGVVGVNGVGKTTLINILSKRIDPDEGWVKLRGKTEYISQLDEPEVYEISSEMASKFGVHRLWNENMSGGEKTRFKIAKALENESILIFADEPTSNMDIEGIELAEKMLTEYKGGLIIISHDRSFLDKLCNKIIELEGGKIKIYEGNYSDYSRQKLHDKERAQFEYEEYIKEKKRLEGVIADTKQKAGSIKRPPNRMGNSEARLHKMGGQKAKANLDRKIRNVEKRIEHLEVKEKPKKISKINIDIMPSDDIYSKIIIEGKKVNKSFGNKIIFKDAEFSIYNGSKVALIGPNGCGKTTLIKMIMDRDNSIRLSKGARIGYFSQDMSILNNNLSIIDNVMESSIYPENFARLLLARLLFKGDEVYKKVGVLSGGEQIKVSFAKILLQDINLLILDEPTNYLDINSLEVMEDTLKDYDRTLLFVSHDRSLITKVATQIMTVENYKIKCFNGTYAEFHEKQNKQKQNGDISMEIILLENRLSQILGRLSMQLKKEELEALDKEYLEISDKLKELRGI
ncbi:MAG: ABC-F type ribosomal protection protein [Bacillota bacterium]|mgnify:CR=1 FL=1|jgi:macrolide transport system ATP-binding/permease protein|nr:ABC-F type ribosomal protection protein [Bacillota bacterium]NLL60144.1 ABC-F type ribosomal protection protein [Tissierellia bacterium]